MGTTLNLNQTHVAEATKTSSASGYKKLIAKLDESYFFVISMVILIGSIWGGITAMFVHKNHGGDAQMMLNVCASMAANIACIGQASTKWVFNLFVLSVIINGILLAMNLM